MIDIIEFQCYSKARKGFIMKDNRKVLSLFSLLLLLTSCGGYEKSSTLSTSSLNKDGKLSLQIPVYQLHENFDRFYFQDGYAISDLKQVLEDKQITYFEYGNDIFITTSINNKTEYFLISQSDQMEGKQTYDIESTSENYSIKSGLMIGWVLIPYFMLTDKTQYNGIKKFYQDKSMESLSVSISCDYQYAKLYYSQSAQKDITYDDNKQSFTIYQALTFTFGENSLVMNRIL